MKIWTLKVCWDADDFLFLSLFVPVKGEADGSAQVIDRDDAEGGQSASVPFIIVGLADDQISLMICLMRKVMPEVLLQALQVRRKVCQLSPSS